MVGFSCCAYAANRAAALVLPGRTDIVSAAGAFVIGSLGNVYSRLVGGTAFTSMVTGVLFLVPVSASGVHTPIEPIINPSSLVSHKEEALPRHTTVLQSNIQAGSLWLFG